MTATLAEHVRNGRPPLFGAATAYQMERGYLAGASLDSLGEQFGCAPATVRRYLILRGVRLAQPGVHRRCGVRVPTWVPTSLIERFVEYTLAFGEEEAATLVRRLKNTVRAA